MKTRMPELRARQRMTQDELAKRAGVRRETIIHLERGRYNPSLLLAYRISLALESSIGEVFVFEESDADPD